MISDTERSHLMNIIASSLLEEGKNAFEVEVIMVAEARRISDEIYDGVFENVTSTR